MTRHKSRVARRSRRRARRGTRKQSGGISFNPLNWFKKSDPTISEPAAAAVDAPPVAPAAEAPPAAPAVEAPAAAPADNKKKGILSGLFSLFGKKSEQPDPAAPQAGGRKTRHRRRPRHHRK